MKKIILNKDADLNLLKDVNIGIIGYGNQGRAQALNLNDRNLKIKIGLRKESPTARKVIKDGLEHSIISEVVKWSDLICILIPDHQIKIVFKNEILPNIKTGSTLLFSHGYAVHYNQIQIPGNINIIMVAPSGGGAMVRSEFLKGSGVPNLIAIEQDISNSSFEIAKSYSRAIGGTRVCAFLSTFSEETETDLFGEQAILTGGIPWLLNKSFKVLIEEGYDPIVSWFVCYYELKTIVDLFHSKGFDYLFDSISETAKYGGLTRGKFLMDDNFDLKLKNMIKNIKNGDFNNELSKAKNFDKNRSSFKELEGYTQKMLKLLKD